MTHDFKNPALHSRAMTHLSYASEAGVPSNQRLEFLGDAALKLLVAELIHTEFPDWPEGELSKTLARLVSNAHIAGLARDRALGPALRMGKGATTSGDGKRDSALADALEALIGAVYEDGGFDAVRAEFGPSLRDAIRAMEGPLADPKSRLQEREAKAGRPPPEYRVIGQEGRDHELQWMMEVRVAGQTWGPRSGSSKKRTEQALAELVLAEDPKIGGLRTP